MSSLIHTNVYLTSHKYVKNINFSLFLFYFKDTAGVTVFAHWRKYDFFFDWEVVIACCSSIGFSLKNETPYKLNETPSHVESVEIMMFHFCYSYFEQTLF